MLQEARIKTPYLIVIMLFLVGILPVTWGLAAESAEQITFAGKVLDDQGQPIEGAKVRFYQMDPGQISGTYVIGVLHEVTTGADGAVSFGVPQSTSYRPVIVVARKDGLAIGWAYWRIREDLRHDIVLSEPKQLRGIVVDADGTPVGGAEVYLGWGTSGQLNDSVTGLPAQVATRLFHTETDVSGRFTLEDLPKDATVELEVAKPGYATLVTRRRSRVSMSSFQFAAGQSDIKLVLPAEAVIEGVVVERGSGKPVSGVKLQVQNDQIIPADRGEFVVSGSDGSFRIGALLPGAQTISLIRRREGLADWVGEPVSLRLQAGETKRDVTIEVTNGGILEVLVTEAGSAKPIGDAHVSIRSATEQPSHHSAVSDANGVAQIRLLPGTYQLSGIYGTGYASLRAQGSITIVSGQTERLAKHLTPMPKISGVVRDPKGRPVEGVALGLLPGGGTIGHSDAQGRFEVPFDRCGWPGGDTVFCLVARHEERNLATAVEVGDGAQAMDLTLKPGAILTGGAVDPNGKAIAGAQIYTMLRVSNWGSGISSQRAICDGDGRFKINAVPADHSYNIMVNADGYGQADVQAETHDAADRVVNVGKITLPVANLSISGRIVDSEGNPVSNATLYGYGDGQPNQCQAQTDAEGRFTLEGVCEGKINLRADCRQDGKPLSARVITSGGTADIRIIVREGRSPVQYVGGKTYDQIIQTAEKVMAGVIVDERGEPMANVPVGVCAQKTERGTTYSSWPTLRATTDAQGRFAIECYEQCQYNLLVSPDHYAAQIVYDVPVGEKDLKITVPDGGTLTGRLVRQGIEGQVPIGGVQVKLEQADRSAYTHLGFDRDRTTTTDADGRFRFEHIRTKVRPSASRRQDQWEHVPRLWQLTYGDITQTFSFTDGDTIDDFEFVIRPSLDDTTTLVGCALPKMEGIEIDGAAVAKDKAVVVCFFDYQQRPSRNAVMRLARQAETFEAAGVQIVAIQVSDVDRTTLDAWAKKNEFTFPTGQITADVEAVRAAWAAKSLPWLILTDQSHTVRAEGFTVAELQTKVGELADVDL